MKQHCPINSLFNEIGRMWILQILREISQWNIRFNTIKNSLWRISSKTLSEKLKELQENWYIEKKNVSLSPVVIEYHLTKKWKSFKQACIWLENWAIDWGY